MSTETAQPELAAQEAAVPDAQDATPQAETPEQTAADAGQQPQAEGQQEQSFELVLPEGSLIDQDTFTEFAKFVKESNVTQEQAQALSALGEKMLAKQQEQQAAERQAWIESAQADKEFGGINFNENLAIARKALDSFGTPELKAALDKTGFCNHPELVRTFYRIGKAISEDKFHTGGVSSAPKTLEDRLFS